MRKSVFITGATGLVGQAMIKEYLNNGYQVFANVSCTRSDTSPIPSEAIIVQHNLDDFFGIEETIQKVDTVIHCAAYVSFNPKEAKKVLTKNVAWTEQIVNLCLEFKKDLVFLSSIAKYTPKENEIVTEESDSGVSKPFSAYADSKYYSELEVWRGIAEGLNAIILNPGIIFGSPRKWNEGSGLFWNRINNGLKHYPTGTCGFIDAKDVATISRLLLEQKTFNQSFILVENNYSYQTVLEQIATSLHQPRTFKPITKPLVSLLSVCSKVAAKIRINFPVNEYEIRSSSQKVEYSNKRLKEAINFQFTPIEETIQRVSEEFLENISSYRR